MKIKCDNPGEVPILMINAVKGTFGFADPKGKALVVGSSDSPGALSAKKKVIYGPLRVLALVLHLG